MIVNIIASSLAPKCHGHDWNRLVMLFLVKWYVSFSASPGAGWIALRKWINNIPAHTFCIYIFLFFLWAFDKCLKGCIWVRLYSIWTPHFSLHKQRSIRHVSLLFEVLNKSLKAFHFWWSQSCWKRGARTTGLITCWPWELVTFPFFPLHTVANFVRLLFDVRFDRGRFLHKKK